MDASDHGTTCTIAEEQEITVPNTAHLKKGNG